jgi:perosamine synthetase
MKYHLFKAHIDKKTAISNIRDVFDSGYLNEGIQVKLFKQELEKVFQSDVILTNSCTSALTIALKAIGVTVGDSVISTSMTCVATNTPIVSVGAQIVWCDVNSSTGMLCPYELEKKITPKTKAVIYVAWAGSLGDIEAVYNVCKKNNVKLILDAAHSFGAKYKGLDPSKNVADIVCYSFQAIKHITTGDGGALVIDKEKNADLYDSANRLKWFGLDRDKGKDEKGDWKGQQWDVDILEAGFKSNMNNISAAIGLSQIKHVPKILKVHKENAAKYDELFSLRSDILRPPTRSPHEDTARWVYTVLLAERLSSFRLQIIEELNNEGIAAGVVHIPNHQYTCFKDFYTPLANVDKFFNAQFSLPCGWWLKQKDIKHIADATKHIVKKYNRKL